MQRIQLEIQQEQIQILYLYAAIGMLQAIIDGTVSADVGIWTLGVPKTWQTLADKQYATSEVIEIFQEFDELSALSEISQEFLRAEGIKLRDRLYAELQKHTDPTWSVNWK
ncbi:MAG: hypothetical protein H7Z42_04200 [Roseiflexaceae bacterium]|nr:hypothetical protein [Roseiflexaceae bacterium]